MEPKEEPKEEQETELEVLEAIYADDFQVLEAATDSSGARFQINISQPNANLQIIFTHPLEYPQSAIQLVVYALDGLSTSNRKDLQVYLEEYAENHLDSPVVHDLCIEAQDWVLNHLASNKNYHSNVQIHTQDDQDSRFETRDATRQEKVEVISRKAIGTPVTIESFMDWNEKFLEELQAKKSEEEMKKESNQKLTGREIFENRTVVVNAESESFWEAEADQIESDED